MAATDKAHGLVSQKGSYSITRRKGFLSINIYDSMEDGQQFLRRLQRATRYSLRKYLNQDMVNLCRDLREIIKAGVIDPATVEEKTEQ